MSLSGVLTPLASPDCPCCGRPLTPVVADRPELRCACGHVRRRFAPASRPTSAQLIARDDEAARRRLFSELSNLHASGDLVDAAASTGALCQLAGQAGWHPVGLEREPELRSIAAQRGVELLDLALEDLDLPPRSVRVVVHGALGASLDPGRALAAARHCLEPSGFLLVEAPFAMALVPRRSVEAHHLHTFDVAHLEAALVRAGFALLDAHVPAETDLVALAVAA